MVLEWESEMESGPQIPELSNFLVFELNPKYRESSQLEQYLTIESSLEHWNTVIIHI